MKWKDVRSVITGKLSGDIEKGIGHDWGWVRCDGRLIGRVKIGYHREMKPHEVGGCARSLEINDHKLKLLVSCTMSRDEYCEEVGS
jgi:hypothetical protein